MQTRRDFLTRSSAAFMVSAAAAASPKDQISLAAWSLVRSFFDTHRWKNPDLPKICSEQLGIHGLEFVNQFFENPTMNSLKQLRRNASDYGVTLVRIMVDDEGNMAAVDRKERMESAIAHR